MSVRQGRRGSRPLTSNQSSAPSRPAAPRRGTFRDLALIEPLEQRALLAAEIPLADTLADPQTLELCDGDYTFDRDLGATTPHLQLIVGGTASVTFTASQHLAALSLSGQARVTLSPDGGHILRTAGLSIAPGAALDLTDNALLIQADPAIRETMLQSTVLMIQSARNLPARWTGSGLTSSTAAANPLLGVGAILNDASGSPLYAAFRGEPADAASILVACTTNGDANLDGRIDAADYFQLDSGFLARNSATPLGGYQHGDFDYNGITDAGDYALIDPAGLDKTIRLNSAWYDTRGNEIEAQGGCIRNFGGTWYWYGTSFPKGSTVGTIKCYSSQDLVHWRFENDVLTDHMANRVDVVYNAASHRYVLLAKTTGLGVATCATPTGDFLWKGVGKLPGSVGNGDASIFQARNGTAYYIYQARAAARDRHADLYIARLSPSYSQIAEVLHVFSDAPVEAPSLFVRHGVYYLFASERRGWNSSATWYTTARSLRGPWAAWKELRTSPKSGDSFNSQSNFVLQLAAPAGNAFIYCGDRWSQFTRKGTGKSVWLPLDFDQDGPLLAWRETWSL